MCAFAAVFVPTADVQSTLAPISAVVSITREGIVRMFHKSLADWLLGEFCSDMGILPCVVPVTGSRRFPW